MDKGLSLFKKTINNLKNNNNNGDEGEEFEHVIKKELEKNFIIEISMDDTSLSSIYNIFNLDKKKYSNDINKLFQKLKKDILNKENIEPIKNVFQKYCIDDNTGWYIYQPNGNQNFPDFLIITKNWIIPLEAKYSSKLKGKQLPKWNSNIPKANCIYLFANKYNLTFFMGGDYISPEIRSNYIKHFDLFKENEKIDSARKDVKELFKNNNKIKNPFGLYPKIRIDYLEKEDFKLGDIILKKGQNIFEFAEINNWEENVCLFLEGLENYEK